MKIVLISTYELGRQPFGIASPAAWLRKRGHQVISLDLSRQELNEQALREAQLIAFFVPMHTAARLTLELIEPLRKLNPHAHLCAYGLYAPLVADSLRALGVKSFIGGEFEQPLVDLAEHLSGLSASPWIHPLESNISLSRQRFLPPDRAGLPSLKNYAHLVLPGGEHRVAGYTEASRGCKHLCRHCPIVPVYSGVFRVVDRDVVLADIRQQVVAGAKHITFGDPDFFNGVGHAIPLVEALHCEFPELTYDVTIKIEHLRRNEELLPLLRRTGSVLITSAVESLDPVTLDKLQKNHTREDFFCVAAKCRQAQIALQPTFVPFTPWTTLQQYLDLLHQLRRLELVEAVAPIQLAIRLLLPPGSRLLDLPEIRQQVGLFDRKMLVYPWQHADPRIDALAEELQAIAAEGERQKIGRSEVFEEIWQAAHRAAGKASAPMATAAKAGAQPGVPYLNEPWYC